MAASGGVIARRRLLARFWVRTGALMVEMSHVSAPSTTLRAVPLPRCAVED
jgi:hypothetical protein